MLARLRRAGARRLPGAAVPGPRDALGVEAVADRRQRLRRQRRALPPGRRSAGRRRRPAALPLGWYGRLHGVDGVEHAARRPSASASPSRDSAAAPASALLARVGGRRRGARSGPARRSRSARSRSLAGERCVGVRVLGDAGADQVLVVEERAAERAHEEVVGERVAARHLPHRQAAAVVVAHRQAAGVGLGGEAVVAAAVDLHDVAVVAMHQVARRRRRPARDAAAGERVRRRRSGTAGSAGRRSAPASRERLAAAVRPPQVGGSVGSGEPSRSSCGTYAPTALGFTPGMPLAPGNRPNRLSKARFSA